MWWNKITFNKFFLAAIVVNFLSALSVLFFVQFLPPVVPLFYGRPQGVEQLVPALILIIAPGVSLIISIINLLMNIWIKDLLLKKILAITALMVSLISTITVIKIIALVGFF